MENPRIMDGATVLKVQLRRLKEWTVATSESDDLKGLYLANASYDAVAEQIPNAIKMLFKAQHNKDVHVQRLAAENDAGKQSTDTISFLAKVA